MTDQPDLAGSCGDDLGLPDSLVQLSFAVHEILGAIATDHEISIALVRTLGILRDREPTMQELARFLSVEKSSVSGLVDRAERRGLVARSHVTGDARAVRVSLTPRGREVAGRFAERVAVQIAGLLEPMGAMERARLSRAATRVVGFHSEGKGFDGADAQR